MSNIGNEALIQKLFPENPMEQNIRPVVKKYVDRVSSGKQLVLKNTVGDTPFNSLNVYGRSRQKTTTGAQLYDVSAVEKSVYISIDADGWITVSCDNTENESIKYIGVVVAPSELIATSTTYTLVCEIRELSNINLVACSAYEGVLKGQFADGVVPKTTGTTISKITTRDDFEDCATMLRTVLDIAAGDVGKAVFRLSVLADTSVTANTFVYEPFTGGMASPNPQYPQEIKSVGDSGNIGLEVYGANLFDYENHLKSKAGLNTTVTEDHGLHVVGNIGDYFSVTWQKKKLPAGDYTIRPSNLGTIDTAVYGQLSYSMDGAVVYNTKNTTLDEAALCTLSVTAKPNIEVDKTVYPIINAGTTPLNFEQYKGMQSFSAPTPNGLPGIPVDKAELATCTDSDGQMWCCDEIDYERGVYVQRVEKLKLTSDRTYGLGEIQGTMRAWTQCGSRKGSGRAPVISNRFLFDFSAETTGTVFSTDGHVYIYPPETVTTVEELKEWLDENETEVLYILEDQIETPISDETMDEFYSLNAHDGITTILNMDGNGESAHLQIGYKVPLPKRSKNSALRMWFREYPII